MRDGKDDDRADADFDDALRLDRELARRLAQQGLSCAFAAATAATALPLLQSGDRSRRPASGAGDFTPAALPMSRWASSGWPMPTCRRRARLEPSWSMPSEYLASVTGRER